MREANEIGSGSGACARQGRGVRRRSAPFRSCSSLGFGLLEENRRAVQRFARLCSLASPAPDLHLVISSTRFAAPSYVPTSQSMYRTSTPMERLKSLDHLNSFIKPWRWRSKLMATKFPRASSTGDPLLPPTVSVLRKTSV